jgi:hypothetical protein
MDELWVQGRRIKIDELDWIRQLIADHSQWGRYHLSVHIAQQWDWRNEVGRLKDMAARTMLLKLERRGLIKLPARQRAGTANHKARKLEPDQATALELFEPALIDCSLAELRPLRVVLVDCASQRRVFGRLLQQHHYLGYYRPVGENLPYLIEDRSGQLLGCALFGAAAWRCTPRDRSIGWSDQEREQRLALVANNMRLLLLPTVRVRGLASHLLSVLAKRLSADWQHKYGHRILLLETFVDPEHFSGTAYRAANWIYVGQTQGRGRQRPNPHLRWVSIKDVYVWPLHARFREQLCRGGDSIRRSEDRPLAECELTRR